MDIIPGYKPGGQECCAFQCSFIVGMSVMISSLHNLYQGIYNIQVSVAVCRVDEDEI